MLSSKFAMTRRSVKRTATQDSAILINIHPVTFASFLFTDVKTFTVATSNKNSSGDEIANVNFYAVRPGSYSNPLK